MAGVLMPVLDEYDVPLLVARGYSSASFVYSAASQINADAQDGLHTFVYHLGDYDPSGQDAARDINAKLTEYSKPGSFSFEQLAVLPYQIADLQLPTRPTKKTGLPVQGVF